MPSQAEHPAHVRFSYKKYYSFRNRIHTTFPQRFHADMQIDFVSRALYYGDTQPALVMSVNPLLIAAYSDEMDAVVMLRFPADFAETYGLMPGSRLTTSNIYFTGSQLASDIFLGENYCRQYVDFVPIVQLFVGKKDDLIRGKSQLFGEEMWNRVRETADEYIRLHPDLSRDGFFYFKKQK